MRIDWIKRGVLLSLALMSVVSLISMLVGGRIAQIVFGALAMLFPVFLIALGAMRDRRPSLSRATISVVVGLAILLVGGFLGMLALAGRVHGAPWFGGLPLATGLLLIALWIGPLALVSLGYGLTFRDHGIDESDLRRLQAFRLDGESRDGEARR